METNIPKRLLALLLTVLMIFSTISVTAFATDDTQTEPDQSITQEPEDEEISDEPEITFEGVGVASADELEEAIASEAAKICITADFELDRTFCITRDVTIYSVEQHTLTRKADFAGDIFVIGEAADGTVCPEKVTLTVGTKDSADSDMLVIDGNKANMTATVTGTVFFVCKNGQADLHPDLTVTNCEKKGNERSLDNTKYVLSNYYDVIGGAVGIIAEAAKNDHATIADGVMNIYGGKYTYNSSSEASTFGGAFFNHGQLNVYDGIFEYNTSASRAGVFYNYRRMNIYKATIANNEAVSIGGAIYLPSSTGAKLYIGGDIRTAEPQVVFNNNTSKDAGAIYSSGTLVVRNTVFEGNTSIESGGAVYGSGSNNNIAIYNSTFTKNEAGESGGAIYVTGKRTSSDVELHVRDTQFTENTAGKYGGAAYISNPARAYVRDAIFSKNSSTSNGGAVCALGATAEFNYVTFTENSANGGGVIYMDKATETVEQEDGTSATVAVPANVTMNKVTATANKALANKTTVGGAVVFCLDGNIQIYNSSFKQNTAFSGSAFHFYTSAEGGVYNSVIEGNSCLESNASNAGAVFVYTGGTKVTLHSCTIKDNTSNGLGGGILVSGKSLLDIYNTTATGNSALKGGFMYETTAGTAVTISGLTVSGNTVTGAENGGGPIIWGNTTNAKLFINKNNYTDLDATAPLDDAYWSAAIVNKLTVSDSDATVPAYEDYTQPEFDIKNHVGDEHTYEEVVTAPTCTEDGYTTYTCACGDVYIDAITVALGHDEIAHDAQASTCTEIGWDAYVTCSRCDYTTYVEKSSLGHDEIPHEGKANTCTEGGWDEYVTCSRCDYTTYNALPVLGHDEIPHEGKANTCTEGGWDAYVTCSRCDYTTYAEKSSLGHDKITHGAKAPTCTAIGWDAYVTCSRCDYTTYAEKSSLGHDEIPHGAKAPTCTAIGWDAYVTCSRCDYTTYAEKTALGHNMKVVNAKAATCTAAGNIKYYDCSRCSHISSDSAGKNAISSVAVAKKAHTYKTTVIKAATLSRSGQTAEKCSCGAVKKNSEKTVYYPKTIKLEYTSCTYNGKTKKPTVTVKDSKKKTVSSSYYTVSYSSKSPKSTGKYSVTITFKGKYSGKKTLYFNILPSKTSKITPTCSTTGLKASWKKVTGASGYKVELLNSKGKVVKSDTTTKTSYTFKKLTRETTYKIRVTAYKTIDKKAVYSTVSTTITTSTAPAKVTLSKVTAGSKSATLTWKTVSGASGYQVQYSTSSKFKSAKTVTVSKGSSKKTTIKKLTKGKKYYFRVRAYRTVGNVKPYGAWSSVKSIKVK